LKQDRWKEIKMASSRTRLCKTIITEHISSLRNLQKFMMRLP